MLFTFSLLYVLTLKTVALREYPAIGAFGDKNIIVLLSTKTPELWSEKAKLLLMCKLQNNTSDLFKGYCWYSLDHSRSSRASYCYMHDFVVTFRAMVDDISKWNLVWKATTWTVWRSTLLFMITVFYWLCNCNWQFINSVLVCFNISNLLWFFAWNRICYYIKFIINLKQIK